MRLARALPCPTWGGPGPVLPWGWQSPGSPSRGGLILPGALPAVGPSPGCAPHHFFPPLAMLELPPPYLPAAGHNRLFHERVSRGGCVETEWKRSWLLCLLCLLPAGHQKKTVTFFPDTAGREGGLLKLQGCPAGELLPQPHISSSSSSSSPSSSSSSAHCWHQPPCRAAHAVPCCSPGAPSSSGTPISLLAVGSMRFFVRH